MELEATSIAKEKAHRFALEAAFWEWGGTSSGLATRCNGEHQPIDANTDERHATPEGQSQDAPTTSGISEFDSTAHQTAQKDDEQRNLVILQHVASFQLPNAQTTTNSDDTEMHDATPAIPGNSKGKKRYVSVHTDDEDDPEFQGMYDEDDFQLVGDMMLFDGQN